MEKIPKDYSPGKLQQIIEYLEQKITGGEKRSSRDFQDLSQEFKTQLASVEKKLTQKIEGKDELGKPPRTLPVPQDLVVRTVGLFVFCSVKPVAFWKHLVAGIRGYEFYGSYNQNFTAQDDDYTQTGTHRGDNGSAYLYTKDTVTPANTFYIEHRVVKAIVKNQLTLENLTKGTSGTITADVYKLPYKLQINGMSWDAGDAWRIRNYPCNKLYSIGPFAFFVKSFKTASLEFYVKARTVGAGRAFSDFVSSDTTQAVETMPAPANVRASQILRPLSQTQHVYWRQDIPYVDILVEWDDIDLEYGLVMYEVKETEEHKS